MKSVQPFTTDVTIKGNRDSFLSIKSIRQNIQKVNPSIRFQVKQNIIFLLTVTVAQFFPLTTNAANREMSRHYQHYVQKIIAQLHNLAEIKLGLHREREMSG